MTGGEHARQPNLIEISDGEMIAAVNLQGGYLEQLRHRGDDLLMPRQDLTEGDQLKDRGGMPLCSPYFGPGKGLGLEAQHGFARDEPWVKVTDECRDDRLVMALEPDDDHPDLYRGLWQKITYGVDVGFGYEPSLNVELELANRGGQEMPVFPGLHPYFPVSPNASPQFRFLTSEFERDVTVRTRDRASLLGAELIAGRTTEVDFVSQGQQVTIKTRDLTKVVVWSASPDKYVCVEPTCGYLGSQAVTPMLIPGTTRLYKASITWKPGGGMRE